MTLPGDLDLADIDSSYAPVGFTPDVVDAAPDPADVFDLDVEADA